ncbi:hypothetical protein STSP2_00383 [Anaerohalosphaera lusitana]|uniref:TIR domain-containing protein n=1 Tax=Anaerohalosphaera lusitana TaxID=1936003 RepID=A0A1U9NI09_9BACT|nr:toll/interleukin-1 receptor domain-containing protein [Anaerohalosphaera lusitana]AQT67240.1 hypothetical protein STSP2_00383 [Anaerohalosphaera lusitana]
MQENKALKTFISYSHLDECHVNTFRTHISPLKNNGLVEDWYDRKILPGSKFNAQIDNNLEDADVICLFVSANFLASKACQNEKENALELVDKKGISVVPIIVSDCGWLDDPDLKELLALPTDGKAVTRFTDINSGWKDVYDGLKNTLEQIHRHRNISLTSEFASFLQDTELLAKAHSNKQHVTLDDIYVCPNLVAYDDLKDCETIQSPQMIVDNFHEHLRLCMSGASQSGKTSLCKYLFKSLRDRGLVPVYIRDRHGQYKGKIQNKITEALKKQYNCDVKDIDTEKLIPILDDFHFAKDKEKHINDLAQYKNCIVTVDDICNLNFADESLLQAFSLFNIKEFNASQRDTLIKKWMYLSEAPQKDNDIYQDLDHKTELVNTTLGKAIGRGIMPAYPFFILSIINTYETFARPLNQEITSQGYCYQALIYMYLRKEGVRNDDIDTYMNFLTEFAFYKFSQNKEEISRDEFEVFMDRYLEKYNLPVDQDIVIAKLRSTRILELCDLNNYSFCYKYLYYFFVAKYLADHASDCAKTIETIINNLHKDEYAYIAIFLSHHSRDGNILEEIVLNACCLFDKYAPTTLSKKELHFFDKQAQTIVQAVLPKTVATPEGERKRRLKAQDKIEEGCKDTEEESTQEEHDELFKELRRSIKTVEVMGLIIKNRAGSLEKARLQEFFEEAMKIHLRILNSFFELIRNEEGQLQIIEYISTRVDKAAEQKAQKRRRLGQKEKIYSKEDIDKLARSIFWNTNFMIVYNYISKIVHSLGSNKLIDVVEKVCDSGNTPASFLVKHGILMWYKKNLQVDNIAKGMSGEDFSDTAKKVMRFLVVNHCLMHSVGFKEQQRIEKNLHIPSQQVLALKAKRSKN